jgi:pimeloyl-ACP methyl ester carboxylesterase
MSTFEVIDGLRINYRRHSFPGRPTLLMTSAWPMSVRCWDLHWDVLAKQFGIVAYDMPGFGRSEGAAQHMSPSAQGRFMARALSHFGIERAYGVGPDVGVPAMLWLAENHPDRVDGLVLFDGPGTYPPVVSWEIRALVHSRLFRKATAMVGPLFSAEAIRRGYRKHRLSPAARSEYRTVSARGSNFLLTLEYLASYPRELPMIEAGLARVRCPVLIMWGDRDPFIKLANAHLLKQRIPHATLHVLAGCGHFAHEDAGDLFSARLVEWCGLASQVDVEHA